METDQYLTSQCRVLHMSATNSLHQRDMLSGGTAPASTLLEVGATFQCSEAQIHQEPNPPRDGSLLGQRNVTSLTSATNKAALLLMRVLCELLDVPFVWLFFRKKERNSPEFHGPAVRSKRQTSDKMTAKLQKCSCIAGLESFGKHENPGFRSCLSDKMSELCAVFDGAVAKEYKRHLHISGPNC